MVEMLSKLAPSETKSDLPISVLRRQGVPPQHARAARVQLLTSTAGDKYGFSYTITLSPPPHPRKKPGAPNVGTGWAPKSFETGLSTLS